MFKSTLFKSARRMSTGPNVEKVSIFNRYKREYFECSVMIAAVLTPVSGYAATFDMEKGWKPYECINHVISYVSYGILVGATFPVSFPAIFAYTCITKSKYI